MQDETSRLKVLNDNDYVLLRATQFIGSTKHNKLETNILSNGKIVKESVEFVPAMLKLFDEIVSNSVDEFIRTGGKFATNIDVSIKANKIIVSDNGRGISHELEETTGLPDSVVAFTYLRAGSNFNDETSTMGQNGVGSACVNIFSSYFEVDTKNGDKRTRLICSQNNTKQDWKITNNKSRGTTVSFIPDYKRLGMSGLDAIHLNLIEKRIIDLSICYPDITFTYQGKKIGVKSFREYVKMVSEDFECFSFENLDIAVIPNDDFDHISFVCGANTYKGGQHVNYVVDNFVGELRDLLIKRHKEIKPADIKNKLKFIINLRNVIAPRFSGQVKEEFSNSYAEFKDLLNDVDFKVIAKKCRKNEAVVSPIIETFKLREELKRRKELKDKEKKVKKKRIAKHIEANSKDASKCTLFLCEGDSAMGQFLDVRDTQFQGAYSLGGKFVNCTGKKTLELTKSKKVTDLLAVLNLTLSSKNIEDRAYNNIVLLTDADTDGDAIACNMINFFYTFWPDIIKNGNFFRALSPLVKAKDNKGKEYTFFNMADFYLANKDNTLTVTKYAKGLGSLSQDDYAELISGKNFIKIVNCDHTEDKLELAFGKSAEARRDWMMGEGVLNNEE